MTARSRARGILLPTIFALAGLAVLAGFGVWQLERKSWKENLIAQMSARLTAAPQPLPPRERWPGLAQDIDEFRRVVFPAEFLDGESALVYTPGSALRPDVSGPGYWVMSPARLPGGSVVIINRGFVPLEKKQTVPTAPGDHGVIDVVGALRWPEARGLFTPADDPRQDVWYARNPQAIAAAKNWGEVAPFYIEQETPHAPAGLPRAGKLAISLPNNHLQYALTWFGIAGALVAVYLVWLFGRLRRR